MYLEFKLDFKHIGIENQVITIALREWGDRYHIPYTEKNMKIFKRVTFDHDDHYAFFAMTWNPDKKFYALDKWRIVSDLNNKIEFDSIV